MSHHTGVLANQNIFADFEIAKHCRKERGNVTGADKVLNLVKSSADNHYVSTQPDPPGNVLE